MIKIIFWFLIFACTLAVLIPTIFNLNIKQFKALAYWILCSIGAVAALTYIAQIN